jgi:hypothetical protein
MPEDKGFKMFTQNQRNNPLAQGDESHNSHVGGAKTPQYVITCKDIFSSDLGKIGGSDASADTAPLLWIETGGARLATYDSSGQLSGDGKIVCKDPIAHMKYGDWSPLIQQNMYEGKKIDKITIRRLISVNSTLVVIQTIDYETCLFKTYEQTGDTITFSFCYTKITDLSTAYDHDGQATGNVGVSFNFGNLEVTPMNG